MYKVIDNFLNEDELTLLDNTINFNNFPWYYANSISNDITDINDESAFFHMLIENTKVNSDYAKLIMPIFEKKLNIKNLIRAKINLYTRTDNLKIHNYHIDGGVNNDDDKVALFYLNDNNGYTELKDIAKIESRKNRMLMFTGNILHRSTNCTDEKRRMNININYKWG